jgi:CheY-specific phosphatase CheX
LDIFESALEDGQPIVEEFHFLEPFIEATRAALAGMADIQVNIQRMVRKTMNRALGDVVAVIRLTKRREAGVEGIGSREIAGLIHPRAGVAGSSLSDPSLMIIGFPNRTAAALGGRILTGIANEVHENLIRDCMGEIANVVAGQSKALLAETPHRFIFSLPPIVMNAEEFHPPSNLDCLIVVFTCDQGEFTIQLFLDNRNAEN